MKSITTFYERAVSLLASQFQDSLDNGSKTNLQKLIASLMIPKQEINDVELQLYNNRWIPTAQGVQLDKLGEILGLQRNYEESDDEYRERLQFQAYVNKSTGTPEEVITALKFFTKASRIQYIEFPYAFFQLKTNGMPASFPNPPNQIVEAIKDMSPASVNYTPVTWYYMDDLGFGFSGDPIIEDLYVSPNPDDFQQIEPFHVSTDGIDDRQLEVNRGQFSINIDYGVFAEVDYFLEDAGRFAEVLMLT